MHSRFFHFFDFSFFIIIIFCFWLFWRVHSAHRALIRKFVPSFPSQKGMNFAYFACLYKIAFSTFVPSFIFQRKLEMFSRVAATSSKAVASASGRSVVVRIQNPTTLRQFYATLPPSSSGISPASQPTICKNYLKQQKQNLQKIFIVFFNLGKNED